MGPLQGGQVGLINIASQVRGWQVAQTTNIVGKIRGWQVAGVTNFVGEVKGGQVGLLNVASEVKGWQVGLVNLSGHIEGGLPIGLNQLLAQRAFQPQHLARRNRLYHVHHRLG